MKGLPGIMIAAGLGIIGALSNWYYISQQARDYEKVSFIAVKSGVELKMGDKFRKQHLTEIKIPKANLGNLDKVAILWKARSSVIGSPVRKVYTGDEFIFHDDLKTPGMKRLPALLAENEVSMSISVDGNAIVTSRVNPGDQISFVVPRMIPRAARTKINNTIGNLPSGDAPEVIGPFRILMVGNRTGSKESFKASGQRVKQENVISIGVKYENGQFEPMAKRLLEVKQLVGSQKMQVITHPKASL